MTHNRSLPRLGAILSVLSVALLAVPAVISGINATGSVRGAIRWQKSLGRPAGINYCAGLKLAILAGTPRRAINQGRLESMTTREDSTYYYCDFHIIELYSGSSFGLSVTSRVPNWPPRGSAGLGVYQEAGWNGTFTTGAVPPNATTPLNRVFGTGLYPDGSAGVGGADFRLFVPELH